MAKILIVEDDTALAGVVCDWLRKENHVVDHVADGKDGLDRMRFYEYELVVLDLNLPYIDGVEVCRSFRAAGGSARILMLTGRKSIKQKEEGLDAGADDYMTKPYHPRELSARIRALLRRPTEVAGKQLVVGDLVLDTASGKVTKCGSEITLVPKEFALLEFFMRHKGEVFSQDALLSRIWSSESDASTATVRYHVARLRAKIDDENRRSYINTAHRVGYRFEAPGD